MIDLTVNIEPHLIHCLNPQTGKYDSRPIEGYEGIIIVTQQRSWPMSPHKLFLRWDHIYGKSTQEVAEAQLLMLKSIRETFDQMIDQIQKPLDEAKTKEQNKTKP